MATESHSPEDIDAEFYIDGAWTNTYGGEDLGARVRSEDAIRITRGISDQQSAVNPVQAVFTLNNRDGLFTDDNPLSPLFGKFGQNTRARLGVRAADGEWDEHLLLCNGHADGAAAEAQYVATTDKASLDITGDIDIRMEIDPHRTRNLPGYLLAAKWDGSTQLSWIWSVFSTGALRFNWTTGGTTATRTTVTSTDFLPEHAGRIAIRITLDVNNGAAGKDAKFYTSDSISGTWTQLGSTVTTAGTTSIFSSTAEVTLGAGANGSGSFSDTTQFPGKLYAFELRNGIAGTLVGDWKPNGRGVDNGITTWTDTCASPNAWNIINGARLGSDRIRMSGELSSIPSNWDKTGRDIYVTTTAAGLLRRLSARGAALRSAIYRNFRNLAGIYAYWPMEDQTGSTQIATGNSSPNAVAGVFVDCTFGAATGLDGSTGCITMTTAPDDSNIRLRTIGALSYTGFSQVLFYFKLDTLPASSVVAHTFYMSGGTVARWTVEISATTFTFTGIASDGSTVDASGAVLFGSGASPLDQWIGMSLFITQEGANVRWETIWHAVGSSTFYTHAGGGDTFAGTAGQFNSAFFGTPDSAFAGRQYAHTLFTNVRIEMNTTRFADVSKAYIGEVAGVRMQRLAEEEGVLFEWVGDLDDTELMGPQTADTLYTNLTTAASVDAGLLGEPRDALGFRYVTRLALGNRRRLELSYSDAHLAEVPTPVRDDRYLVNDFTANRPSGSSFRYEADDGRRLNVNDPPDGAGRYEQSGSVNVATDDQLPGQAQLKVFLGTWDERRIPNLALGMHRSEIFATAGLLGKAIAQDLGDEITLGDLLNSPMPPDDLLMITFGYTETIRNFTWDWVANTVPAGPYQVDLLDDDDARLDARVTSLNADYDDNDVSLVFKTADTETISNWVTTAANPSEFPFDVEINGEVMTVTAMGAVSNSGGFDRQTATVTRGINGITRAHDADSPVFLNNPIYLG